jgi:putative tryptophan/tyrosine transport system substrate-binding protein
MKRWAARLLAVVMFAGAPLSASAQQAGGSPRIGMLSPAGGGGPSAAGVAFRNGLRDLGYIDGGNITIEVRLAAGDFSRLRAMASELVQLPVDLIFTDVAQIASQATRTIPIVSATLFDPIGAGLAASLAHPGGNVTGLTLFSEELSAKRLQLLQEAIPARAHIAVLWNPAAANTQSLYTTKEAARTLGLQLSVVEAATPDQIDAGLNAAIAVGAEALVVIPDEMFWEHRGQIVSLAAEHRLPAIYPEREYADDGGLLAYGPNVPDNFRRAAAYVDKILKGAKPGDLPIEQPARFDFVVNLNTARALGLTIPPSILARADEVIE